MISIILAMAAMAFRDALATLLTVAEARGKMWRAARYDAIGDFAGALVTIYGVGPALLHGWTLHTGLVLLTMMATSFAGTAFWTKTAQRWMPAEAIMATKAPYPVSKTGG